MPALRDAWPDGRSRTGEPAVIPFGTLPTAAKLEYYAAIGCTEVALRIPAARHDAVLTVLDDFAQYVSP